MKIKCKRCKVEKEHNLSFFKSNKINGKVYLEKTCKECRQFRANIRARERYIIDPVFKEKALEATRKNLEVHRINKTDMWKKRLKRTKEWKQNNLERIKEKEKGRHQRRWQNSVYRISKLMSNRINHFIKDKNSKTWLEFVDYSVQDLMNYLESKFTGKMSWENYGPVWHIDHIKPVSHFKFDSYSDQEFKDCWALPNLQPLLKEENLKKGNRYIG